jgi:hypothetical protein
MSASCPLFGGKADSMCSVRDFPGLTRTGPANFFLIHRQNRRKSPFDHSPARVLPSESATAPDRSGDRAAPKARCCRERSYRQPPVARQRLGQAGPKRAQGPNREPLHSIVAASAPARRRRRRSEPDQERQVGPAKDAPRRCRPSRVTSESAHRRENCPGGSRRGPACLEHRKRPHRRTGREARAQNARALRDPPRRCRRACARRHRRSKRRACRAGDLGGACARLQRRCNNPFLLSP